MNDDSSQQARPAPKLVTTNTQDEHNDDVVEQESFEVELEDDERNAHGPVVDEVIRFQSLSTRHMCSDGRVLSPKSDVDANAILQGSKFEEQYLSSSSSDEDDSPGPKDEMEGKLQHRNKVLSPDDILQNDPPTPVESPSDEMYLPSQPIKSLDDHPLSQIGSEQTQEKGQELPNVPSPSSRSSGGSIVSISEEDYATTVVNHNNDNVPQSEFDRALTCVKSLSGEGATISRLSKSFDTVTERPSYDIIGGTNKTTNHNSMEPQNNSSRDEYLTKQESLVMDEIMSEQNSFSEDAADGGGGGKQPHKTQPRPVSRAGVSPPQTSTVTPLPPPPPSGVPQTRGTSASSKVQLPPQQNMSNVSATNTGSKAEEGDDLSSGVLPDVLMTMRQKIESLTMFDTELILGSGDDDYDDDDIRASKESLRRSFQQSISAAVLVSLAHKRYERRRLAAMEIEKVVRSLVQQQHQNQGELERVRAILLLLSDDYVRSTNEDARKGGVVALAACAIGLKKSNDMNPAVMECKDLILASVVHACQDHSQRVRYYATESLFNVVKVIPTLAVQHFFILFEILRSLYADVDLDVRSGAELLDKKLKEVIVGAINSGSFTADACIPLFARYLYLRNKATKRLTLTWLHDFSKKLIGAPILEFLHLFLGGIFAMVADPNASIRQSALDFLQSVLPKLLVHNEDFEDPGTTMKVDFDKILQSLVTTMEHPDPFVRKVAMSWMCRIVKAHMGEEAISDKEKTERSNTGDMDGDTKTLAVVEDKSGKKAKGSTSAQYLSAASISVRNSVPHVLPGILLSIGDTFHTRSTTKDSFLPDQTTHSLAEQTNACLQNDVRRDGKAYVSHLDGFIVALREELDSPGGLGARNPPAIERKPYRMDVQQDGSGIESTGWFRASEGTEERDDAMMMSRLCALQWVTVLYENVVPDSLKAEYAREFITPIIHQLVDNPPELIIFKSFEVLGKITVPVPGEMMLLGANNSSSSLPLWGSFPSNDADESSDFIPQHPMDDASAMFALDILDPSRRQFKSRDREVFAALIHLHSHNHRLLPDLSRVIEFMCTLQPSEFVFISFSLELDRFVANRIQQRKTTVAMAGASGAVPSKKLKREQQSFARDLEFVSSFVQQMSHVLLNANETAELREALKDSIGSNGTEGCDKQKALLFHILLHSFAHNTVAAISLCMWAGAYRTASTFLHQIDPLDVNLMLYLQLDQLIELLERPLFRHLHLRMLEGDVDPSEEGSSAMLFLLLKSIAMLIPQSTSYNVLSSRLTTLARFRQSAITLEGKRMLRNMKKTPKGSDTEIFVIRMKTIRAMHCEATWRTIRMESLEPVEEAIEKSLQVLTTVDEAKGRRDWLGYANEAEENAANMKRRAESFGPRSVDKEGYNELHSLDPANIKDFEEQKLAEMTSSNAKDDAGDSKEDEPRHPDEVLPKDQVHNFQALARHGLVVHHGGPSASTEPEQTNTRRTNLENGEKDEGEEGGWKDYWMQPTGEVPAD